MLKAVPGTAGSPSLRCVLPGSLCREDGICHRHLPGTWPSDLGLRVWPGGGAWYERENTEQRMSHVNAFTT